MPWCDACDVFVPEEKSGADHLCPDCGDGMDIGDLKQRPPLKVPWHFWVLVLATGGYLAWRLVEGLLWLVERWF